MKILLNKGFKVSSKIINLLIRKKENDEIALLKLLFQHSNYNNDFILNFLLNYYWNKILISQSDLNSIVLRENEKLSEFINTNSN